MTKIVPGVLFVALGFVAPGLAMSGPPVVVAGTSSAQGVTQSRPTKASAEKERKAYLKQQKKRQKKTKEEQKRAEMKWKKQHPKNV